MDFSGWERLSLLDYDDRIATTFFMAGCNFRCPFCHNSSLVLNPKDAPTIPWEEMRAYLIKRQGVIDAVCIIYNLNGYYDLLEAMLDKMTEEGFVTQENREKIHFCRSLAEIGELMEKHDS